MNIAAICAHRGEEPVLGGEAGICNVFFAGCNMRCLYCQNHQISRAPEGLRGALAHETDVFRSIDEILDLGAPSIGFVSPSHCFPQTRMIIDRYREDDRVRSFVWNTNAYDRPGTIDSLQGSIDVYLPDFKYSDERLAREYSSAPGYPEIALVAIAAMIRQKGVDLVVDDDGIARSGVIIRHLVLPGEIENSIECLRLIAGCFSPRIHLSLMAQYHPTPATAKHPNLGRKLTTEEYERVTDEMEQLGFENGWTQELESSTNYQPDFRERHPFERS